MRRGETWIGNTLVLLAAFLIASSASATEASMDGFGSACDACDSDLNGDGVVGVADFNLLRSSSRGPQLTPRIAGGLAEPPRVEILFPDTQLNEIAVTPGSSVIAQVWITATSEGVSSYGVSVRFDDDLDLDTATELLPTGFDFNLSEGFELLTESNGATLGDIQSCEAVTFGAGVVGESFLACEIEFVANANLADDGEDIFVGLFATGVDGIFASDGGDLASEVVFTNASVHPTPEPSAGLSALAVVAGLMLRRKLRCAA